MSAPTSGSAWEKASWMPDAQRNLVIPATAPPGFETQLQRPLASRGHRRRCKKGKTRPQPLHCPVPGPQEQTSRRSVELFLVLLHVSQWLKMSSQQRLLSVPSVPSRSVSVQDASHRCSRFVILPYLRPLPCDFAFPPAANRPLPLPHPLTWASDT